MYQSETKSAMSGEFTKLQVQTLEASHRLAGLRRHLEELVSEPTVSSEFGSFNALLALLAFTAILLLLI